MADDPNVEQGEEAAREERSVGRGDYLKGLQKWSAVVIGVAASGRHAAPEARVGGINRRGGWVNGGGGSWVNRRGSWISR